MIRPFANTTLTDIICNKIRNVEILQNSAKFYCAYEYDLLSIARKYSLSLFIRSIESANCEGPLDLIYEWHKKLSQIYDYVIYVSGCTPLLSIKTLNKFVETYISTNSEGLFAVTEKKNYFWDSNHNPMTPWTKSTSIMNTKMVDPTYEAAHCLYASRIDSIASGVWMSKTPFERNHPELFVISSYEGFDIDEEWQFEMASAHYANV